MPAEENKAIVQRAVEEIWNYGDLTLVDEIYATNFIGHWPDREISGTDGIKEHVASIRSSCLNIQFIVHERIAEGDRVLTRFVQHCTRKEHQNGVAPISKHENREGTSVVRFEGPKIAEQWVYFET